MEGQFNSIEEVELGSVARAGDRNTSLWQRQQQLQRWKNHLQRLVQALEAGNLQQARYEFDVLMNVALELGQTNPLAHSKFLVLGRALENADLAAAREALHALLRDILPARQHTHEQEKPSIQDNGFEDRNTGKLDVRA
jgi:hypothetical protein